MMKQQFHNPYDSLGRRTAVTNALGQVTHTAYDLEGRAIAVWGATYPVAYEYDAHGRMTAMGTYRGTTEITDYASFQSLVSSFDKTHWFYDEATGLLTNKVYADGKGTAYTYTPDGKLATRAWARGVTTTYAYTNGSSLVAIDYSDSNPDVTYQYDRLGRLTRAVTVGVSTNIFTYDGDGAVTSEAVSAGGEHVLTRLRDALGRDGGWMLSAANGLLASASYRYDETGLFEGLSWSNTWDITGVDAAYTREYGLITGRSVRKGAGPLIQTAWNHEIRGLITTVENTVDAGAGANTISRYDYVNDALDRRTAVARSGLAHADMPIHDAYGYNSRSEVTSARRYRGTDHEDTQTPVRGFSFDYDFDAIGNRTSAGTYSPANEARVRTYTANALNQYTQATVPGYASVRGTAVTNATVTVNGLPVWRLDEYFYGESPATNTAAPAWQQMRIVAVVNPPGTNDPDVVSCVTGHVFVARTPEVFTYDDDGNLTGDGRFTYTWDAENRLAGVETRAAAVAAGAPKVRIAYAYDHQSRRVGRRQYVWLQDDWSLSNVQAFRYDGWNLIAETSPSATNLYAWGLDLSGSLQSAGGIGGLLAGVLAKNEEPEAGNLVAYAPDANGNVMQFVDATDGTLAAAYEYSPFGETIVSTGPLAKANPFRFSTKHWDDLTGLGYWGYRYYHPDMGRWMSRDPVGEVGGRHLYAIAHNELVHSLDVLGLRRSSCENAVDRIFPSFENDEDYSDRYKIMREKGCSIAKPICECCDKSTQAKHSFDSSTKVSTLIFCDHGKRDMGDWLESFKHEFSHAFDYCLAKELPAEPCKVSDEGWSFKICTELRAYSNGDKRGRSTEDIISSACNSVYTGCNFTGDRSDLDVIMEQCKKRARQLFLSCTLLGRTDPLPPVFPPSPPVPIKLSMGTSTR